jgi:hypothetical protein
LLGTASHPSAFIDVKNAERGHGMLSANYLRRQADNCLRIARTCFDLAAAERLRRMATELQAKADESEAQTLPEPHQIQQNDSSKDRVPVRGVTAARPS